MYRRRRRSSLRALFTRRSISHDSAGGGGRQIALLDWFRKRTRSILSRDDRVKLRAKTAQTAGNYRQHAVCSRLTLGKNCRVKDIAGEKTTCGSLQLRVLSFRRDENGDIGVPIFPEREEILIRSASFRGVALYCVGDCAISSYFRS
jgi:hypothetical protein